MVIPQTKQIDSSNLQNGYKVKKFITATIFDGCVLRVGLMTPDRLPSTSQYLQEMGVVTLCQS